MWRQVLVSFLPLSTLTEQRSTFLDYSFSPRDGIGIDYFQAESSVSVRTFGNFFALVSVPVIIPQKRLCGVGTPRYAVLCHVTQIAVATCNMGWSRGDESSQKLLRLGLSGITWTLIRTLSSVRILSLFLRDVLCGRWTSRQPQELIGKRLEGLCRRFRRSSVCNFFFWVCLFKNARRFGSWFCFHHR